MIKKTGFKKKYAKGAPASSDTIADAIILSIKEGVAPWMKSCQEFPPMAPRNALTGQIFSGLKAVSILATGMTDPRWCTYKQSASKGWQVQKNPTSVKMKYFSESPAINDLITGESSSGEKVFRTYYMFNASQIKNVPAFDYEAERQWGDVAAIDEIVANSGLRVINGSDVAIYSKSEDCIYMPNIESYARPLDYYADLVHEIARWTGGPERLNRTLTEDNVDVIEELRINIASLMLCAKYGLPHNPFDIAAHTDEIVDILASDKREIARSSMAANDVCDYILQFAPVPDFMIDDSLGDGLFDDELESNALSDHYDLVKEFDKKTPGL